MAYGNLGADGILLTNSSGYLSRAASLTLLTQKRNLQKERYTTGAIKAFIDI